jgi:primosomal protein N' (replication factor Y)
VAVGAGTQRVENELQSLFADYVLARLDRDAAGSGERIDAVLSAVAAGETDILVGTQMLTKGHDFARVTLVGILNADQGLFGTGFRGEERLAQSIVQVAGRAGRRDEPGELIVQTHFPNHPLLRTLLESGYLACAQGMLEGRRAAGWPPFSAVALITAESQRREAAHALLRNVRRQAQSRLGDARLLGPAPAAMERRQGRYRAQLLLQSAERSVLHAALGHIVAILGAMRVERGVRWAIDVDPIDV